MRYFFLLFFLTLGLQAQKIRSSKIKRIIKKVVSFEKAHVGIAIQALESDKRITGIGYEKYMTPASNIKLLTFFGSIQEFDSLPILKYKIEEKTLHFKPTGYPLLFHPFYPDKKLKDFLNSFEKIIYHPNQKYVQKFGPGWSWDDYPFYFSAEISTLPLHGNVARISKSKKQTLNIYPSFLELKEDSLLPYNAFRDESKNIFKVNPDKLSVNDSVYIPIKTSVELNLKHLNERLQPKVVIGINDIKTDRILYSNDLARIYKPLLQNSDNLIAESLLIMIGENLKVDYHNTQTIEILKNKWKTWIPDQILWFDGSGVSRYSMITPRTIIAVLQQINKTIGLDSIKKYFPAGGISGTIRQYYNKLDAEPYVFAKTGTLKNNHNLSGYIISKSGRWYVFSIMVNHYNSSTKEIRLGMAQIIDYIYNRG